VLGCLQLACSRASTPRDKLDLGLARQALTTYADIARASYGDAVAGARSLQTAVQTLLAQPSEATLAAAQRAWLDARAPYLQSEVFRFYDGPIDRLELALNTWPIDESYVEGEGGTIQGVIDDAARYPTLDAELLVALNGRDGETSVSTGYHVIEFLLWGRDTDPDGPGRRPASDYLPAPDTARRRHYLALATALLVQHLEEVERAWQPSTPDSYRARFLALPPHDALALALRGMGALSGPELAGERLTVGYETKDQENEQSCFSDSTQQDVVHDVLGLQNVCLGRYGALRGPGLCTLLASADASLGETLTEQIAASLTAARQIPAPFDRALLGADDAPGRRAIKATLRALDAQTQTLARAAALLGVGAAPVAVAP
jgi:putative iron-regulated protein